MQSLCEQLSVFTRASDPSLIEKMRIGKRQKLQRTKAQNDNLRIEEESDAVISNVCNLKAIVNCDAMRM